MNPSQPLHDFIQFMDRTYGDGDGDSPPVWIDLSLPATAMDMSGNTIRLAGKNRIDVPAPVPAPAPTPEPTYTHINVQIQSLHDFIALTDTYEAGPNHKYNINMDLLHKIRPHLVELNGLVGLKGFKNSLVDQILYFIQGIHQPEDYKHTILLGPPGTGKTEIAKILGRLFLDMGVLHSGAAAKEGEPRPYIFKKVTRNDLIAGYLGQTAIKTKDVIESCIGGVLFIDEAYSLTTQTGDSKTDIYAKECVDILCESLSHHRNDLMVIVAGYEKEMQEMLKSNTGLESRFLWRHTLDPYSPADMHAIFRGKAKQGGWDASAVPVAWFEQRKKEFPHFGRDMEKLLTFVKIKHARRAYGREDVVQRQITQEDMTAGMELFMSNRQKPPEVNFSLSGLYV